MHPFLHCWPRSFLQTLSKAPSSHGQNEVCHFAQKVGLKPPFPISQPYHASALLAQLLLPQPPAHSPRTSHCSPPSFHLSMNSRVFVFQKNAKRKISPKPRPSPAANCVPTFKTCKPHLNSCCHYCALCKCRIFQTICQCLMLNPKC